VKTPLGNGFLSICLIGGSGRSGTTILKRIFARHPDVAWVPEWRGTIDPDGLLDFLLACESGWSPYRYDLDLKRLMRTLRRIGRRSPAVRGVSRGLRALGIARRFPIIMHGRYADVAMEKHCPGYLALVDRLEERLVEFRFAGGWAGQGFPDRRRLAFHPPFDRLDLAGILGAFFRDVVRAMLRHQGAAHYVEDNTWNILWFDRLRELVPEARLVHIRRHPLDVVASYTSQRWMPTDSVLAARVYHQVVRRWRQVRDSVPSDTFYEVSLEALVESPEPVLRALCAFWGIEWSEQLLGMDLSRSHAGRWKRDLPPDRLPQIQAVLQEDIEEQGYSVD